MLEKVWVALWGDLLLVVPAHFAFLHATKGGVVGVDAFEMFGVCLSEYCVGKTLEWCEVVLHGVCVLFILTMRRYKKKKDVQP